MAELQGRGWMIDMGYRERSLWASLLAVALLDTLYFAWVLGAWWSERALGADQLLGLLLVIASVLVVIEVGFVLATRSHREPMDERDQAIAAGSARLAYGVFALGVLLALGLHLLNLQRLELGHPPLVQLPLIEVHLILGSLVTAELCRFGSAIARYRSGA